MVPHANSEFPAANGENCQVNGENYTIPDLHLGHRRPIRILAIGFGVSGINVARVLGQTIKNSNIALQIYEKNPELGGTWFENM